ncbi:MAG TPA: SAM-dependent chlorinase/fluorinase [Acidobacteriota bacterium]|nr:SAM-dependent chlorinase/fluorinase [Acidobacteriota bacterium]
MGIMSRTVTLLTDFGLQDHYVGSMKGVMLTLNPDLHFVDISHAIPPHDILTGAFVLGQAVACFPPGTIHLAVVDPGVGTVRKAIVAVAAAHFFVAPDNGLLSFVYNAVEDFSVHEITADHYFRKPISSTFHGRDIFAPVAAWVSKDIPLRQFGPRLDNPVRLNIPTPTKVKDSLMQAAVLVVDVFGNLITNLKPKDLPVFAGGDARSCKVLAGKREITSFHKTFGEGKSGELFIVPGSSGYLEIVVREGSAASELGLKAGAPIGVVLG